MKPLSHSPSYFFEMLVFYGLLLGVALFALVWTRVAFASLAGLARVADRFGLLEASESSVHGRNRGHSSAETWFIRLSASLAMISNRIPGDAGRYTHVTAILVTGAFLTGVVIGGAILLVVPLHIFLHVAVPGSPDSSLSQGIIGVFGYFIGLLSLAIGMRYVSGGWHRVRSAMRRPVGER